MNETEARTFRAAYGAAVTRYTRMTTAALRCEWWALMADAGMEHLYGTMSKDELLSAVLNLRGYTIAKLNETAHVLHHQAPWPDCEHCQADAAARDLTSAIAAMDPAGLGRAFVPERGDLIREITSGIVPTGTGWPVGS